MADLGFPGGGAPTPEGGGANLLFDQFFPKTAWKWRNFGPEVGACVPCPPLRSATVYPKEILTIRIVTLYLWNVYFELYPHRAKANVKSLRSNFALQKLMALLKRMFVFTFAPIGPWAIKKETSLSLSLGLHTAGMNLYSPSKAKSLLLGVNRPLHLECTEVWGAFHPQPQKSLLNCLKLDYWFKSMGINFY